MHTAFLGACRALNYRQPPLSRWIRICVMALLCISEPASRARVLFGCGIHTTGIVGFALAMLRKLPRSRLLIPLRVQPSPRPLYAASFGKTALTLNCQPETWLLKHVSSRSFRHPSKPAASGKAGIYKMASLWRRLGRKARTWSPRDNFGAQPNDSAYAAPLSAAAQATCAPVVSLAPPPPAGRERRAERVAGFRWGRISATLEIARGIALDAAAELAETHVGC